MPFNITYLENEITDQYLHDDNPRPWIIGFSGGKDSTLLLQLVWNALSKIKDVAWTRDIYVVCNDTLVENPRIVEFIERTLKRVEKAAVEQGLPIRVERTRPRLEDTFWLNVAGKGYPSPTNMFRWCTERLKINPTTRFITEKINEKGEAIILLGTRSDESSNRARSIKKHEIIGQRLRKHILPNAFVYAPIKDVTTNELWQYMMQVAPPWGGTHKELVTLYRNANSGDCPLVIDDTTPSCGSSRFGCWVCTVVSKDKSMDALIENGESWMEPLVAIRDYLIQSRDDKETHREKFGRGNRQLEEGQYGPYKPHVRAKILEMVLNAQFEINKVEIGTQLITNQELIAIQIQWYRDGIYNQKVSDIYNKIYNKNLKMGKHDEKFKKEEELLTKACNDSIEQVDLIQRMLAVQKAKTLMLRKRGLQSELENVLDNYLTEKKRK